MATRHTLYGSCLFCGRAHCIAEVPADDNNNDNTICCYFCGKTVLPPKSAAEVSGPPDLIAAYLQKDKLLQFDRENAKRTQVLDAQADYYVTSNWLSEEEKRRIDDSEASRRNAVQSSGRLKKMGINISSDGKASFAVVEEEAVDAPTRSHQELQEETLSCSAADAVAEESQLTTLDHSINSSTTSASASASASDVVNSSLVEDRSKAGEVYRLIREEGGRQAVPVAVGGREADEKSGVSLAKGRVTYGESVWLG